MSNLTELLCNIIQAEHAQWMRYTFLSALHYGPHTDTVEEHFSEHAANELEHARLIIRWVTDLGGIPPTSVPPVEQFEGDLNKSIKWLLQSEIDGANLYHEAMELSIGIHGLQNDIGDILSEEHEHMSDLMRMIEPREEPESVVVVVTANRKLAISWEQNLAWLKNKLLPARIGKMHSVEDAKNIALEAIEDHITQDLWPKREDQKNKYELYKFKTLYEELAKTTPEQWQSLYKDIFPLPISEPELDKSEAEPSFSEMIEKIEPAGETELSGLYEPVRKRAPTTEESEVSTVPAYAESPELGWTQQITEEPVEEVEEPEVDMKVFELLVKKFSEFETIGDSVDFLVTAYLKYPAEFVMLVKSKPQLAKYVVEQVAGLSVDERARRVEGDLFSDDVTEYQEGQTVEAPFEDEEEIKQEEPEEQTLKKYEEIDEEEEEEGEEPDHLSLEGLEPEGVEESELEVAKRTPAPLVKTPFQEPEHLSLEGIGEPDEPRRPVEKQKIRERVQVWDAFRARQGKGKQFWVGVGDRVRNADPKEDMPDVGRPGRSQAVTGVIQEVTPSKTIMVRTDDGKIHEWNPKIDKLEIDMHEKAKILSKQPAE